MTLGCVTYNVERDRLATAVRSLLPGVATHSAKKQTAVADELTRLASYDVLCLQETAGYAPKVLAGLAATHRVVRPDDAPGQAETCIAVRRTLDYTELPVEQLTTKGWTTVRGGHTPPKWTPVVEVAGVEFRSVHMPPTIQSKAQRLAARRRWAAAQQLAAALNPSPVSVTAGDWNMTPKTDLVRTLAARLHAVVKAPAAGTHGRRVIDYALAAGVDVVMGEPLDGFGSDHRPVPFSVTVQPS